MLSTESPERTVLGMSAFVACNSPRRGQRMDLIAGCLSLAPVPGLHLVFVAFRNLWSSVERVRWSKRQLLTLATCIDQLLQTLNREVGSGFLPEHTEHAMADLQRWRLPLASFRLLSLLQGSL
jgi:hypothetical protein